MRALLAALLTKGSTVAALKVKDKAKLAGITAFAGIAFFMAFVFLLIALYQGLVTVLPGWGAALIMAGIMIVVGLITLLIQDAAKRRSERRKAVRAAAINTELMAMSALLGSSTKLAVPLLALGIGYLLTRGGDAKPEE